MKIGAGKGACALQKDEKIEAEKAFEGLQSPRRCDIICPNTHLCLVAACAASAVAGREQTEGGKNKEESQQWQSFP
ncbi:MAG: hypothetical protein E7333_04715 [Clostridiales bacterium]|nr:hypothetical protein [Clostridiales bacterium]